MKRTDVVIVGAGVVGLSVGFHLLQRDRTLGVIIVERAASPGAGSTSKATGGIRHQFGSEPLVRLSQWSVQEYRDFEAITGVDVEFEDIGYLLFSRSEQGAAKLRQSIEVQRACGVIVEQVGPDQIADRWPYLSVNGLRIGSYTRNDGHADPYAAVTGYLRAFRSLGGRVLLGEEVVAISRDADRVTGVRTTRRLIATPVVVNAAGVHAAQIASMVGLDLPVRSFRRQVAVLGALSLGARRIPFTLDSDSGWYMHRLSNGAILLGGTDKDTHPGFEEVVDPGLTLQFIEIGLSHVPLLAEASLIRSYAGLRALTPDDLPFLGPVESILGFFCACGLAGHGFMHAPAVGDTLARWILQHEVRIPGIEAFLPQRLG